MGTSVLTVVNSLFAELCGRNVRGEREVAVGAVRVALVDENDTKSMWWL